MNDIKSLRSIQSQGARDLSSTLRTIEINSTDICNRKCSFCPHGADQYETNKRQMSLDVVEKIGKDLADMEYNGRITFTGFGEPLLYKNLIAAIKILSRSVTKAQWIEIVTNGDYLTEDKARLLEDAGCTNVTISMYDRDISDHIQSIFDKNTIQVTLKHLYNGFDGKEVNRNSMLEKKIFLTNNPCYFTFYKMMIDIDGSIRLCANDWSKSINFGNIKNDTIGNLWLSDRLTDYRKKLINGNRRNCVPCKFCNVDGTIDGHQSVEIWKNNL